MVLLLDGVLNIVDSVPEIDVLFAVTKFPARFSIVPFIQASVPQSDAVVQAGSGVLAHRVARPDTVGFK